LKQKGFSMPAQVIDVSSATFERDVLEASKQVPVVVDFWAPWCGPCRALGPVLEKLAAAYGGRFKLAKINSDENQDLAAAFGVRSIPTVIGFRDGRPVSQFLGAVPESQARAFIDKLLPTPSQLEQARAAQLRTAGNAAGAADALCKALELDASNDAARLDLAELLIELGRAAEASTLLDAVRPDVDLDARVAALRAAVAFAQSGADEAGLRKKLAANPADFDTRLALAGAYAGKKRYREALDELLEIVRRQRDWNDGAARKQVLNIFNLAGDQPELVSEYRRKLASALY
jgi:putative thioredoxin